MKNKKLIVIFALVSFFVFGHAKAQTSAVQQPQVDYYGQSPVDTDLDALTDQSEIQIYRTDPKNPDTDGDGYFDGAEVLAGTDPLDANSIPGMPSANIVPASMQSETPWPWYVARASGLVGFVLLYLSIFLGLTIRVPFLRKIFAPLYAMQGHCWIAFQATLFALIHGVSLMLDKYINFRAVDVFIPFASKYQPGLVAMGIVSFYLMVILTASSYARKYISQKLWRALHSFNIILYVFVIAHAYNLGTDMQSHVVRNIFVWANAFLIVIMLINMFSRIRDNIVRKNAIVSNPEQV